MVRVAERGDDVRQQLETLREEVRSVLRTLRETLYDLRTDVRDDQDLGATMEHFLDRVRERSGLEIDLELDQRGRLPLLQEKELWRIAKEAVINAERHAQAKRLDIRWRCDGRSADLVVRDDGVGFRQERRSHRLLWHPGHARAGRQPGSVVRHRVRTRSGHRHPGVPRPELMRHVKELGHEPAVDPGR